MTEALLQRTIKQTLNTFYPELIFISSTNGINLTGMLKSLRLLTLDQIEAIVGKMMHELITSGAMYKGEADVRILLPKGIVLNIELKRPGTPDGKGQSPDQIKYQKDIEALGHKYYLCNSLESFFKAVNDNLDLEYRLKLLEAYKGKYSVEQVAQQLNVKDYNGNKRDN